MVAEGDMRQTDDLQPDLLRVASCNTGADVDHPGGLVVGMVFYLGAFFGGGSVADAVKLDVSNDVFIMSGGVACVLVAAQ